MKIGILGSGQLSKMLALSGIPLGIQFVFYFPETEHSLHRMGDIIHGAYDDEQKLKAFAQQVDVITYENENIPVGTIEIITQITPVFPDKNALAVSQDRLLEKNFFTDQGIPTNKFLAIESLDHLKAAALDLGFPFILKKRRQGYDGKGQIKLNSAECFDKVTDDYLGNSIAEEYIDYDREVSMIIARNHHAMVHYDLCENTHKNGILIQTENHKQDPMQTLALDAVTRIANELDYVGVLAVEFFQVNNQLLANEMAPRVHNSGHWTIDACMTSQFENHLRAVANLPLGNPASITQVKMLNLLSQIPDKAALLNVSGLRLHDYMKTPRSGRKLGHVTLMQEQPSYDSVDVESLIQSA